MNTKFKLRIHNSPNTSPPSYDEIEDSDDDFIYDETYDSDEMYDSEDDSFLEDANSTRTTSTSSDAWVKQLQ